MIIQPPVKYPQMIVKKSDGVSASEKKLIALGYNTFLQLWSYPNPYKKHICGKELCDLLVVFEDDIIIFSDKDCHYDDTIDPQIAWRRWYNKAIKKSFDQLYGAKSWIINHTNEITLDAKGQIPFPLEIRITPATRIHLIAVAHGASNACKKAFSGGDGGLIINTTIVGDMHKNESCIPFHVGLPSNSEEDFIHIFDDASYATVLQELDTIRDFVKYLEARKQLLLSKIIIAASENELLAQHIDGLTRRDKAVLQRFAKEKYSLISFEEGFYQDLVSSKEYRIWKSELKKSYFWDDLLKDTFRFIENGQSYSTNLDSIQDQSKLFYRLAAEDREHRLALSDGFLSFFSNTPSGYRGTRVLYQNDNPNTCYVLLLLPRLSNTTYEEYRKIRSDMLSDYCKIIKIDFPDVIHIIGVAHEGQNEEYSSEDFIYLDTTNWTEDENNEAKILKAQYQKNGLLGERNSFDKHYFDGNRMKGRDRNKLCPCGSGKKFKKCCGRFQT